MALYSDDQTSTCNELSDYVNMYFLCAGFMHFILPVDPKNGAFTVARVKSERFLYAKEESSALYSSQ